MSAETIVNARPAREAVADEVRAAMARRRLTGRELSRRTGKSQPYWSRRLTGELPFNVDDLDTVASYLDVEVVSFFRDIGVNRSFPVLPGGCSSPALARDELALAA